jgi:glycosyltransferase involved in cell wall biosynthesis
MKLSIVVPTLGQHELTTLCISKLLENITNRFTDILVIDNGGDYACPITDSRLKIINMEKNIGVYPTFQVGMDNTDGDIVAFFHSDLIVNEKGFDTRLINVFEIHDNIGLVGFVGSNEIDYHGGRGAGTTSNFQGGTYDKWQGSPASAHGRTNTGLTPAAVVDGCAMVLRRETWNKLEKKDLFHHFYDKIISCQVLEARYKVAILGVACDHISGQTVNAEPSYRLSSIEWLAVRGIHATFDDADSKIYQYSEDKFLTEYRDIKHLIPIKV